MTSFSTGTDRSQPARGPTLYVANFDFDDRLAKPAMTTLPKSLRQINARLAPALEGLCGPDDAVAVPGDRVEDAGRFGCVEPWGVEPHVLRWLELIGVRDEALRTLPGPAAVRAVNGRRWQHAAELALAPSDDHGRLIGDRPSYELASDIGHFASIYGGYVLKSEFGGSGRGVRLVCRSEARDSFSRVMNELENGRWLLVEPYDAADAEISAHLTITKDAVTFDGLCSLRSTPAGQFESVESLPDPSATLLEPRAIWEAVAERARAEGYRGYLGIDAAVKDGRVVRAVRDVNARWTMGRVALQTGRPVHSPMG